jgi:hypothetical protein
MSVGSFIAAGHLEKQKYKKSATLHNFTLQIIYLSENPEKNPKNLRVSKIVLTFALHF